MSLEAWLSLAILSAAILLFITEWLRVDVVALGVVVALMLTGVLTTSEALAGFANPAVLTIASLFVVGGAVMRTGLAAEIGQRILRVGGSNETRLVLVLMAAVALLSSVMSDTGTVAVLLPAVVVLARNAEIPASRLLLPLSYGALLGGATTIIGTPPNLIVSDLLRQHAAENFEFFDFTPMGFILVVAGIIFVLLVGRRLLPDRVPEFTRQRFETPEELVDFYRLPDNLYRLRVRRGSDLAGKTLFESELGSQFKLTVVEVLRGGGMRTNVGDRQKPSTTRQLQPDDVLLVQGKPDDIAHAAARLNLGLQQAEAVDKDRLISEEVGIAEVILPRRSQLAGQTLVEAHFGSRYGLTVLALQRPGSSKPLPLKETRLQFGDLLLVQGPWRAISDLRDHPRDFVVVGEPEAMTVGRTSQKAWIAMAVLLIMLALMITNLTSVAAASMVAALLVVLAGCVSMDEAYEAVDWKSVVLVAGMIPMSTALEKVALVDLAAQGLTESLGGYGPLAVMAGLFLLTSGFTQVLSNTATAVVLAPVALSSAQSLGVTPHAFLMTVAIAASMAFASPVASPVNTLVMGAGDYRFGDYLRLGAPLILLTMVLSLLVLPLLFPFR
ncbi:MAG: SLC13 family permease [Anaerolineales bacterium]